MRRHSPTLTLTLLTPPMLAMAMATLALPMPTLPAMAMAMATLALPMPTLPAMAMAMAMAMVAMLALPAVVPPTRPRACQPPRSTPMLHLHAPPSRRLSPPP